MISGVSYFQYSDFYTDFMSCLISKQDWGEVEFRENRWGTRRLCTVSGMGSVKVKGQRHSNVTRTRTVEVRSYFLDPKEEGRMEVKERGLIIRSTCFSHQGKDVYRGQGYI